MIEAVIANLERAIRLSDVDQFKVEFEENEKEVKSYRGANGLTLAHIASYWGSLPILSFMKSKNVNLDASNDEKDTPLFHAVDGGVQEAIAYLLSLGVSPNHRGYLGRNSLFTLASSMVATKKHEILEILVENGADINHTDDLGLPFIIYLVNENRPKLLEAVIPYVRDINLKDNKGRTALDYSEFYTCKKGVQQRTLLLSAGAISGAGFSKDERPFDWITYSEDPI